MLEYITYVYGPQIMQAILYAIFAGAAVVAYAMARKYLNTETKRKVAKIVVAAVEQIYKALHGEEKMAKALEHAAMLLKKYGIKFDAAEMRLLLEAALGEFNKVFDKLILEGVAVEDLDDDQLRELLKQLGFAYTENMNRQEMLAALDEIPAV